MTTSQYLMGKHESRVSFPGLVVTAIGVLGIGLALRKR